MKTVEIDFRNLSPEALQGVVDDFILREGTDYGAVEASLKRKREDIYNLLKKGLAKILFETETETITLVPVTK